MLAMLDRRLRSVSSSEHRPHTLLIGPRGAGKTHLVEVALHRARQEAGFADHVRIVRFDEDMVGISRYRHVLRAVHERLQGGLVHDRPTDLESAIAEELDGRPLVLVVENLDRLFRSLGEKGQQDLRAWVENSRSVMLLATAPLLFDGVSDRHKPWYGNFDIHHLDELDLDAGTALLTHLAEEEGDTELAAFLVSERGQARLNVINLLAGGSPRIWMILFDCISVELLDELTPAVESLLEGLVPYYQQLLWDLPDNEQRLVQTLADGSVQAMTVSALAEEAELDQRTVATSLGRLADARWVRAEKPDGTDKRTTWYRLREPLLRHHLHYRSAVDQPLPLIVELLRAWFDPEVRRHHLVGAPPGSASEGVLARSLTLEPHRFDSAYVEHDVEKLLADARRWALGEEPDRRTREAGALIEFCVTLVRDNAAAALALAGTRISAGVDLSPVSLENIANNLDRNQIGLGEALDGLYEISSGRTAALVELVAAVWSAQGDPARARDRLKAASSSEAFTDNDLLRLDIRDEYAFWTGMAGDAGEAQNLYKTVVADRVRLEGVEGPDTLAARGQLAAWTGEVGDAAAARDLFAVMAADQAMVLGADDRDTLLSRHNLAHYMGMAGATAEAREMYQSVAADRARVLGADDRDTLFSRHNLAHYTGEAGDAKLARDMYESVTADRARVLGSDDRNTLSSRHNLAYWTGRAGDADAARDMYKSLVIDRERIFGADDADTLMARNGQAHWTGRAGNPVSAREQCANVVADSVRVLGAHAPGTTTCWIELATWTARTGEPAYAVQELASLMAEKQTAGMERDNHLSAAVAGRVIEFMEAVVADRDDAVDTDRPGGPFLTNLRDAIRGEPGALTRIPGELVEIVEAVRSGQTVANALDKLAQS